MATKIAFSSSDLCDNINYSADYNIYVANVNGTGVIRLTTPNTGNYCNPWSPG